MNQEKIEQLKEYVNNKVDELNTSYPGIVSKDKAYDVIKHFVDSNISFSEAKDIVDSLVEDLKTDYVIYNSDDPKYKELYFKYKGSKTKYGEEDYKFLESLDFNTLQSYNNVKKGKFLASDGREVVCFIKGNSNPNECELLVSRLGRIMDVPVCNYGLFFNDGIVYGLGEDINPDETKFETLSGYDFVSDNMDVVARVRDIKNHPNYPKPILDREETKKYIDAFLDGIDKRVSDSHDAYILKCEYFKTVLFNWILDQKDYNYTNFSILRNKEDNTYHMGKLFDNGNIRKDPKLEGTMITTLGRSSREDILDLLFNEYYPYIEEYANYIFNEVNDNLNGNSSIVEDINTAIDDTLSDRDVEDYKQTVNNGLVTVMDRVKTKKKVNSDTKVMTLKDPKTSGGYTSNLMLSIFSIGLMTLLIIYILKQI